MTVADAKLHDEPGRLLALQRYQILDTPKESEFDRITDLVAKVLDVPLCGVSLVDIDRQWFKSCVGFTVSQTKRDISFCSHTIMAREPLHITDATLDERFVDDPLVTGDPFIRSYLGVPLSTPDGYNVGSLCALDTKSRTFSSDQIAMLKSFASLVVHELELRNIAHTDFLTGAATRRSFCLDLDGVIAEFRRSGAPATLLMLDIDHFKLVNDTYGHPVGDRVLRIVATELMSELRVNDVLGRVGGEEFGVLLRDSKPESATEIAERFRMRVETIKLSESIPSQVTISLGIVPLTDASLTSELWMATGDEELYRAKRAGRNRCCMTTFPN